MRSIFEYDNYRNYLQDHYAYRKNKSASYSFRFFARKAGLDSANYYKLVMDSKRNLTHKNVKKFSQGLGLNDQESHYFENLVFYNQAENEDEAGLFLKNLDACRENRKRGLIEQDQYDVFSKWYPITIKELALLENFYAKPKWIAARLDYKITPEEAKSAVELLERLRLIEVEPLTKKIKVTQQSLQTPDVIKSDAVMQYHLQMLTLAQEALMHQSSKDRCFSALTVAVDPKDLPAAFTKIHEFRNELDSLFGKSKKLSTVYQLGIQLFRLDTDV